MKGEGEQPAFYEAYVREVQAIIAQNARLEFDCLWEQAQLLGKHALSSKAV